MKHLFFYLSLSLLISVYDFAQIESSDESEETLVEQRLALEAEQNSSVQLQQNNSVLRGTNPLFIGVDDVTIPVYLGDPATNMWDPGFTGFQIWGAAYDNVNDKVYFNNGSTLYEWSVGGTPVSLGTIVDTAGATQSMVALAFYNGTLYGTKNIANEAIWEINTTTLVATVVIDYVDGDFDLGGLAVDPTTGDFYGTNDDVSPHGAGLFRINPDGTGTMIAPYPAGETDIDGLAISTDRKAYWIVDEPGSIYVYDLVAGTFLSPLTAPWTSSETFCGGTWISGVVPVELASFNASVSENTVNLYWKTASETNNRGFSVERKSNNTEFTEAGFVQGFGTTTESKSYSFNDKNLQSGVYTYRLKQIDFDGTFSYSQEIEVDVIVPASFSLEQNYPNPFNPTTTISFSLAVDSRVTLIVYDILGQEAALLINKDMTAGVHSINFNASGLNSGVYFYRIEAKGINGEKFVEIKKMTLTK